jgi:tRNA(fMet)-specific endonuclease VapC
MKASLLDTDTLSEIMKGTDEITKQNARKYLATHDRFKFSLLTRYEILRGLKVKQAAKQIEAFESCCQASEVISLSDAIIVRGADIYAELRRQGQLISDADILIASTALTNELVLITNNTSHFRRIPGLMVESWKTVSE